jgi:hypothetical protein
MAYLFIKFPKKFLDSEEWQKPRKYSKTEALLYLLYKGEHRPPIRQLADIWGWRKSTVMDFISYVTEQGYFGQISDKFRTQSHKSINKLEDSVGQNSDKLRTHNKENKNNPPVLSTTNVVSNTIPPKGMSESNSDYQKFNEWLKENAPRVLRMKEPITEEQFISLKTDFDTQFLCDLLREMHNYEPLLKKNRSANLTLRNWAKRRKQWDNGNTKSTTNTAGNAEPDELLRQVAEGIARSRTAQAWQS